MAGFRWAKFVGSFPSKPQRLMAPNELLAVSNAQLDRGTLRPFPTTTHITTPGTGTRSFYYYRDPDDAEAVAWLTWDDAEVSVAASPVVNDTYDRLYWSGDTEGGADTSGRPKVASKADILGTQTGPYPEVSFYLGVPEVATTVTAARTVGAEPDPSLASSYTYVATYVTDYGEEGPPSFATDIIDVDDSTTFEVEVTVPWEDRSNREINVIRLYVAFAGSSQDDWKFVKEVARLGNPTATTITHEVPIADLSIPLVSILWEPPPTTLRGLRTFGSGLVGYSLNELCFSEDGFPHAWPVIYRLPTEHPITGIGVYGNTIFVGTMGGPYIAYGHGGANMSIERLDSDQACVSQASIAEMENGVVYASPTGLYMATSNGVKALTEGVWSRSDFADLEPTTFQGARWNNMYVWQYGTTVKSMFACYPSYPERGVVELTTQDAYNFHYDTVEDKLYYLDQSTGPTIRELFDLDAADMTMGVTTGTYVSARPTNISWMQVEAYSYPLTISLYSNSHTGDAFELVGGAQTVTSRDAFRLPSGYLATAFYCVISSNDEIESVIIAESSRDLRQVS